MSNLMKIRPLGAELFHINWRTDVTNVVDAFCSSAKVLKNLSLTDCHCTLDNMSFLFPDTRNN
jgi:hypothetical protein